MKKEINKIEAALKETLKGYLFSRMLPLMLIIVLLISSFNYFTYLAYNLKELKEKGRLICKEMDHFIKSELNSKPILWKYNTLKFINHARGFIFSEKEVIGIYLTDEKEIPVLPFEKDELVSLSNLNVMWIKTDLFVNGYKYGETWVAMDISGIKNRALTMIFPAFIMGLLVSFLLFIYIRSIISNRQKKIELLVSNLKEAQIALETLNIELEIKVEERTSQLNNANLDLEKSRNMLAKLAIKKVMSQEEANKWLSRELHDSIGQILTAIAINVELLSKNPSNLQKIKTDTQQLINAAMDDLRSVISFLRPALLDEYGLKEAIKRYIEDFIERTSISVDLILDLKDRIFQTGLERSIFRIIQESTTNIIRHSKAKKVQIVLKQLNDQLILKIWDDGTGFNISKIDNNENSGITGMRERAEILGGKMELFSEIGQGTILRFFFPFLLRNRKIDEKNKGLYN